MTKKKSKKVVVKAEVIEPAEPKPVKTREEINIEIQQIFHDTPLAFGRYYFPHHFRSATPYFHVKLLNECVKNRFFAAQCPRGAAKTTLLSFLYPMHQICFKKRRFIVIVQNTYDKATNTLETLKAEFRDNAQIKGTYGIVIERDLVGDTILRHPDGFKQRILCKGASQMGSIRGEKYGAYRPDLFIVDDLEDDEMVRSPDRRQILQQDFDTALVPAGDFETCQYVIIGTILHDDCLMAKLVSNDHYKKYRKLFYIARWYHRPTKQRLSLWEEKWSVADLDEMERHDPETFAKEYQGDPVSGTLRKFDKKDFRRWYIENNHYHLLDGEGRIISKGLLSDCRASIGCDLAWEEKKENDSTVIMPCYLTPDSELLVDDYFCEKGVRPDQFEEMIFPLEAKLKAQTNKMVTIGMEKGKLEKVMKWCMTQAMKRRNHWLTFKNIQWTHDKVTRIVLPLQPRYKMHSIYHKSGMGDLEYQLLRIPSGTHDDLPDALQMAVRTLEYAPTKSKESITSEDPGFDWLRHQMKKKKDNRTSKKPFVFGKKKSVPAFPFPTKTTWG